MAKKWMRMQKLSRNQQRVYDYLKREQEELSSFPEDWEIAEELQLNHTAVRMILNTLAVRYELIRRKENIPTKNSVIKKANQHGYRVTFDFLENPDDDNT